MHVPPSFTTEFGAKPMKGNSQITVEINRMGMEKELQEHAKVETPKPTSPETQKFLLYRRKELIKTE